MIPQSPSGLISAPLRPAPARIIHGTTLPLPYPRVVLKDSSQHSVYEACKDIRTGVRVDAGSGFGPSYSLALTFLRAPLSRLLRRLT